MNYGMQLEPDLIVNKQEFNDYVKCAICQNVYLNPIACGNCLNHFCMQCIRTWHEHNPPQSCPLCRTYKEMRCVPLLKQILSKLIFKCINKDQGCNEQVPYDNLMKHADQCEFKEEICPSGGCGQKMTKGQLAQHLDKFCQFIMIACQWCKIKFRKNELANHQQICELRMEKCPTCEDQFFVKTIKQHIDECPEMIKICLWCKQKFRLKVLSEHQDSCDLRIITCVGCRYECRLNEFIKHSTVCEEYPVFCNRCQHYMKRKELEKQHDINQCVKHIKQEMNEKIEQLEKQNTKLQQAVTELQEKIKIQEVSNQKLRFSSQFKDMDIFVQRDSSIASVREQKKKRRDRFILVDLPQRLGDQAFNWKFTAVTLRSVWFAVGITDENNVYIQKRYNVPGHSSYLISANGILYSSHNPYDNSQYQVFNIDQGDVILCAYKPSQHSLKFKNMAKNMILSIDIDIDLINQGQFYPCACLRCPGDQVKVELSQEDILDEIIEEPQQQQQNPQCLMQQSSQQLLNQILQIPHQTYQQQQGTQLQVIQQPQQQNEQQSSQIIDTSINQQNTMQRLQQIEQHPDQASDNQVDINKSLENSNLQ